MPQPAEHDQDVEHDVVGVGFGPANLAVAIATHEHNAATTPWRHPRRPISAHFVERQESFGWHTGMLIDDATMQVSFLKDLVTLRNPASDFSFLSYLHDTGRLVDFVNHKTLFPLRTEFHDYFTWCARRLAGMVTYGREVTEVRPVHDADSVVAFDVHTSGPAQPPRTLRTRNVVLATGLRPRLPDGVQTGPRVWHNSELLHRVSAIGPSARRFVVVGAGQSAAETTAFLHDQFRDAEICSVFSRFGYSPSDDSPYANRIFDPASVDTYFAAPQPVQRMLMDYHANTNYSVVDVELIEDLYRRDYRERAAGKPRLRWFNTARVVDTHAAGDAVAVTVESLESGEHTVLDADAVVFATGYLPDDALRLLGPMAAACHRDGQGRPRVDRDYRVQTDPQLTAGVYLQGGSTEHTHGITSSLLSNNAVRSGEIVDAIAGRVTATDSAVATPVPAASAGYRG